MSWLILGVDLIGPQVPRHLLKHHSECVCEGVLYETNIQIVRVKQSMLLVQAAFIQSTAERSRTKRLNKGEFALCLSSGWGNNLPPSDSLGPQLMLLALLALQQILGLLGLLSIHNFVSRFLMIALSIYLTCSIGLGFGSIPLENAD